MNESEAKAAEVMIAGLLKQLDSCTNERERRDLNFELWELRDALNHYHKGLIND